MTTPFLRRVAGLTVAASVLAACAPDGGKTEAADSTRKSAPSAERAGPRDPATLLAGGALPDETPHQALWSNRTNLTGLASYRLLAPPLPGRDPGALVWYRDHGEQRLAFMRRADRDTGEEIYYLTRTDGEWSSPIATRFSGFRIRALADIASLSTGRPMLLMVGDNTDYARVYGPGQPQHADEELLNLQNQNRRLFSSFAAAGTWSRPQPISGSLGALFASLESGPDRRALAIFARDTDNAYETATDRDLYASAFDGVAWHPAFRLTADPGREYAVETAFIGGEFIAVWTRDADADLETRGDRTLQFATFAPDGTVTRGPAPITDTAYDRPRAVLGERAGHALVLFAGNPVPGTATRPLLESRLDVAWSPPQPTGLQVGNISRGTLFPHAGDTLLLYEDDNHLVAAVNRRGVWHSSGVVQSYNASDFRLGEAAYTLDDQANLTIAVTGTPRTGAPEPALYHVQLPLHADLGVGDIVPRPRQLQLGDTVMLSVPASNRGYLPSGPFDVTVSEGGVQLAAARNEADLYPGESRTIDLRFPLTRPQHNLTVTATAAGQDLDLANNTQRVTVAARPDFAVTSVERTGTTLIAQVRDLKAVATTAVNVDFVLIEGTTSTVIGQKTFDPNVALSVGLDYPPLATKTTPFVIAVRVNDRTQVIEDNYANNLSSYTHQPGVDFVLAELAVTSDSVRVVVRNLGDLPAERVSVLLTTSPELSASPEPIPGLSPIALQDIAMQGGRAVLELPRTALDGHDGYFLYAIANPYGTVPERDRNNNALRASRRPSGGRPAFYAFRRIVLKPGSQITGDLAVRDASEAQDNPSLEVSPDARIEGAIRADRIRIKPRATVIGAVAYNSLVASSGSHVDGDLVTPLTVPVAADIPALPPIVPGSGRVQVARGATQTLAAGAYGEVCIGCTGAGGGNGNGKPNTPADARLLLSGGTYHFASLTLAANGHLACAAACEIRVAGNVTIARAGSLGPATAAIDALSVRLFVAGGEVSLAGQATLTADAIASNGTVKVGSDAHATGRIAAVEIELDPGAQLTSDSHPHATRTPLPVTIHNQSSHRGQGQR